MVCGTNVQSHTMIPRSLFCIILEYNKPEDPGFLWRTFWRSMSHDYLNEQRRLGKPYDEVDAQNSALLSIKFMLEQQGISLASIKRGPPCGNNTISFNGILLPN